MNKKYIIIISLLIAFLPLRSRAQEREKILNSPVSDSTVHIARDVIRLKPGFNSTDATYFKGAIDEELIVDASYQTNAINPATRQLDYSKPVGAVSGSASVSPTGAALYQIPIAVPPGTAGMQPQLSIVYNSQGGNGNLGIGWDIAGLSVITRSPQTLYFDNESNPVTMHYTTELINETYVATCEDRFALDGERLIMLPETGRFYGDTGAQYVPEREKFCRITTHEHGQKLGYFLEPNWFKVEAKDGHILEYGRSDDSRLQGISTSSNAFAWKLNKTTDANGNYIRYVYEKEGTESWIRKIEYTGNEAAGEAPYNTITFLYERRSDIQALHLAGGRMESSVLLREIKIEADGEIVRRYLFKYHYDFYTHLSEVIEEGSDGTRLNSTIVEWGGGSFSLKNELAITQLDDDKIKGFADFNRDGKDDILYIDQDNKSWAIYKTGIFNDIDTPCYTEVFKYSYPEDSKPYWIGVHISPPDAKGKPHVFLEERRVVQGTAGSMVRYIYKEFVLDTHNDETEEEYGRYLSRQLNSWSREFTDRRDNELDGDGNMKYPTLFHAVDVQGNGEISFMVTYPHSAQRHNNGDNLRIMLRNVDYDNFINIVNEHKNVVFADFTGDGRQDMLTIDYLNDRTYLKIYRFNNTYKICEQVGTNNFDGIHLLSFGDFDGDRKQDILLYNTETQEYQLIFSLGNNLFSTSPLTMEMLPAKHPETIKIGDFNGDGKDDILYLPAPIHEYVNVFFSKGDGSFKEITYSTSPWGISYSAAFAADCHGYGTKQLIYPSGSRVFLFIDEPILDVYNPRDGTKRWHYVNSITDGFNRKIHFQYKPLTVGGDFYQQESCSPPLMSIQSPLYVVSSLIQDDGIGGELVSEYSYRGAVVHREGKGFLGFSSIKMKNSALNVQKQDFYAFEAPFYYPYLSESKAFTYSGSPVSTATMEQSVVDLGTKRTFPFIKKTNHYNHLTSQEVEEVYTYDMELNHGNEKNGNVIHHAKRYKDNGTVVFTDSIYNTYSRYGGWGPKNVMTRQERIGKHKDDNSYYKRYVTYEYDNKGNLTKELTDVGVTTSYLLNNRGLAIRKTITASGILPLVTNCQYDSHYRFVTEASDCLGTTYNSYDRQGLLLSTTDAAGLTTSYQYDGFGRVVRETVPQGHTIATNYAWEPGHSDGFVSSATTTVPGRPTVKTYYDIMGREARSEREGPNSTVVCTDRVYDAQGRVVKESLPYFSGEAKSWTNIDYDGYGRVALQAKQGLTTTYTYVGNKTTVTTPDGRTHSKTLDAHGAIVRAEDMGGAVTYKYHSSGQPKEITANGATFSMEYDAYGRQIKLHDPNAGTISYSYTKLDELEGQVDAQGQITVMEYDACRRLQRKTSSVEGYYDYTYVSSGNGKGQLESVSSPDGFSNSWQYDEYGNVVSLTESNLQQFVTQYTYDEYGNNTSITYPGGFAINRIFDNKGYLARIKRADNGRSIWLRGAENALGQPLDYLYGNWRQATYRYDSLQFLQNIAVDNNVLDLEYQFNHYDGNLEWRRDGNQWESFYFDEADRLRFHERAYGMDSVQYTENGNIKFKSGIGGYSYDEAGPHAVTGIHNVTMPYMFGQNQAISYTSFQKAAEITEGDYTLTISYGADQQRVASRLYRSGALVKEKHFASGYEQVITPESRKEISYIASPYGMVAAYVKETLSDNSVNAQIYYIHTDYQGSLIALSDEAGASIEHHSYDAWGRPRNPDNWESYGLYPSILDRGYTFHEHLPEFRLINMNGRIYDPVIARFLSPDPYVQAPESPQNYNRYSYCLNNPLKYTDPSGYAFKDAWKKIVKGLHEYAYYMAMGLGIVLIYAVGIVGGAVLGFLIGNYTGMVMGAVIGGGIALYTTKLYSDWLSSTNFNPN